MAAITPRSRILDGAVGWWFALRVRAVRLIISIALVMMCERPSASPIPEAAFP